MHGHLDVVPGRRRASSSRRIDGDRLIGRGAYDMKGALAVMMLVLREAREQDVVRLRLGIVSDEESEEEADRGSDALVDDGFMGDFAITGEPTNLQVGVQAKGVLAMRLEVGGRSAHGATPWLGDNAIVKALEVFRAIESLPFARQSSRLFDRPSINLGRIMGGDALNRVPDQLRHGRRRAIPSRTGPRGDPGAGAEPARHERDRHLPPPAGRGRADDSPFVAGLCDAASPHHPERVMSVGRDGASDAVSFLRAGVPAVEFGPVGDGHHGPEEWVSVSSLGAYRKRARGLRQALPDDGPRLMAGTKPPTKKPEAKKNEPPKKKPRSPTQTEEYALGDDFLADLNEEDAEAQPEPKAEGDTEVFDHEEIDDPGRPREDEPVAEEPPRAEEPPADDDEPVEEEAELEELINAETEEWDGIEAEEDHGGRATTKTTSTTMRPTQTLVARASSTITRGVRGRRLRHHLRLQGRQASTSRFPMWARFLTAGFLVIVAPSPPPPRPASCSTSPTSPTASTPTRSSRGSRTSSRPSRAASRRRS